MLILAVSHRFLICKLAMRFEEVYCNEDVEYFMNCEKSLSLSVNTTSISFESFVLSKTGKLVVSTYFHPLTLHGWLHALSTFFISIHEQKQAINKDEAALWKVIINFVVVESERSCTVQVTSKRLHITGSQANNGSPRCGTRSQPWVLEAPAGQRINVTLFDFTPTVVTTGRGLTSDLSPRGATYEPRTTGRINACAQQQRLYGYITDKSAAETKKNVSVCGDTSGSRRLSHVYLSTSNVAELVLTNAEGSTLGSQMSNFLVGFEGNCLKYSYNVQRSWWNHNMGLRNNRAGFTQSVFSWVVSLTPPNKLL